MDIKSYQLVEQIYNQVKDESPADIEKFVIDASKGDSKIVDKVMHFLTADESNVFDKTSGNILFNLSEVMDDWQGKFESDRYKLIKKIGTGGMGSVYLAKRIDEDIEHKVAIKLINTLVSTDANIDRFKKERQILASLDHENIARFIDVGTSKSGMLFVVMEYIQGISLKQYSIQNKLNLKQKLNLFLQLCNAIEYAHKHFIIHRDIKPANILVNKHGRIKLLDFGIAKLIDEDEHEMAKTLTKIMTPAYASPEQLLGKKITVQSDIYALGIVLFELILGFRPYKEYEADTHAYQVKVINGLSTKPSQLLAESKISGKYKGNKKSITGDIDALLTKVINPDEKQRYGSVAGLKSDISNYLNGYPVKARKANWWYFFKLFVGRNKLIMTLLVIFMLVMMGFSIFSYIQNEKLKNREVALSEQRDEAILQAKKAKLASGFLLDSFQTADPIRSFGEKLTIKQVMQESYEKLKKQPLVDSELNAELYLTISQAFYGMRVFDLANEAAINGLLMADKMKDKESFLYVSLLIEAGKGDFVNRDYQQSLNKLNSALKICIQYRENINCKLDEIYQYISKNQFKMGDKSLSIETLNLWLNWMDERTISGLRYAKALLDMAAIYNNQKLPDKALMSLEKVKLLISPQIKAEHYYYLTAMIQGAYSLILKEEYLLAQDKLSLVLKEVKGSYGEDNTLYISALNSQAVLFRKLSQFQKAISHYQKIIEIKSKLDINRASENSKIGNIYYHDLNDYDAALKFYSLAVYYDNQNIYNVSHDSGFFRRHLAFAYYQKGNIKMALKYLKESRKIFLPIKTENEETLKGIEEWIDYLSNLP